MSPKAKRIEKITNTEQMNTLFKELYTAYIEKSMTPDEMLVKLDNIEYLKFTDFKTWIPMHRLIMLKSHLLEGDPDAKHICQKRVGAVVSSLTDDQIEAFDMMLEGEITGVDLLDLAKETNDKEWERSIYITIIAQLMTVVEMGASRKFGYPIALRALEKYIRDARHCWRT